MATTRVFVTGSTGLLGNSLVRQLLERGFAVRALFCSRAKAEQQFAAAPRGTATGQLEIVEGDLANVAAFAPALCDVDVLYHAAAYFRDSYAGGSHTGGLEAINYRRSKMLSDAAVCAVLARHSDLHVSFVLPGWPHRSIRTIASSDSSSNLACVRRARRD